MYSNKISQIAEGIYATEQIWAIAKKKGLNVAGIVSGRLFATLVTSERF